MSALLCVTFIALLLIAQSAARSIPTVVTIPSGGLSDSVFDAQNSVYEADAEFPVQYDFIHINASVDVPELNSAVMGKGEVWKVSDGFYIYITEGSNSDFPEQFYSEIAPVLLAGADEEKTTGEIIHSERGYLNGFELTYVVLKVSAAVDEKSAQAYVVGYLYEDDSSGYSAFISCATQTMTTAGLSNAQIVAEKEVTLMQIKESTDAETAAAE